MLNIHGKVTIETFLKPFSGFKKICNHFSFWGAPKFIKFQNLLLELKNQRSGSKTVCGFSIILILKGIMTFESQRFHAFC